MLDSCLKAHVLSFCCLQENINRLIEVWDDPQHVYLVLEYVDGGDLLDYIMNRATDPGPGLCEWALLFDILAFWPG
jgi:serine/threonine protein kinase